MLRKCRSRSIPEQREYGAIRALELLQVRYRIVGLDSDNHGINAEYRVALANLSKLFQIVVRSM